MDYKSLITLRTTHDITVTLGWQDSALNRFINSLNMYPRLSPVALGLGFSPGINERPFFLIKSRKGCFETVHLVTNCTDSGLKDHPS